jgi:vitamin B12 transporter
MLSGVRERRLPLGAAAIAACFWSGVSAAQTGSEGEAPRDGDAVDVNVRAPKRSPMWAPKDATVAGAVISREELDAPGAQTADVLRGQVGLQVSQSGGNGAPATASVRGATPAQLPVYLAGVRLNDDVAGTADLSKIPLWLIDRIEIYRGNAPLEADRLGIAGALFFEPRWPHGREVGAGASLGSFGARSGWAYGALGDRDASVLVGVSADGATNDYSFANDHGTLLAPIGTTTTTLTNADATTYDAWILGRVRTHGAVLDTFANVTTREQGITTLAQPLSREARAKFDRAIGGAHAIVPLGGGSSLEAQTSISSARAVYSDPIYELALGARRVEVGGDRVLERVALRASPTSALTVHAAADVASETLSRDDDGVARTRARRLETRLSVGARQWIGDSFSLQPIGAIECNGTSVVTERVCDAVQPTGRFGIAWTRPTWDAFANVGRYVRVPALGELYGISAVVRGNSELLPESGNTIDAGLRWRGTDGWAGSAPPWALLNGFVRWADDLIAFVRTAQGFAFPENVNQARVAGVEVQAGAGFLRWFAVDANATLLDPRNTTPDRTLTNDVIPFQSRFVASSRLSAEGQLGFAWLDRVRAEVRFMYQSSRYADAAGLGVMPDQSSLDLEALAQTRDAHFTLRARLADVLDAERYDIVGFPLPRRAGYLALEAKW